MAELHRHPPEHDRVGSVSVPPAGCCCCCCCCCLHTLGGLGGAITGSTAHIETHPARSSDPKSPFPFRFDVFEEDQPLISPVLLYWLMVLLAIAATIVVTGYSVFTGGGGSNLMDAVLGLLMVGIFVSVMIFPALQLVASILSYIVIGIFYPERSYALRRVTKITWYSFIGGMIGMLFMGGCLGLLMLAK